MTLTSADAERLQQVLEDDGVAVLPTDTVYGLACNTASERAIERLYELKGRPSRKPSAVMFFSLDAALGDLPELGARTAAALRALLPGPVTPLVANPRGRYPLARGAIGGSSDVGEREPSRPGGSSKTASGQTEPVTSLGMRVPLFEGPLAALAQVSVPALQSSANLSGGPDPSRLSDVPAPLREGADLVLDGGELPGTASTVVDLSAYEQTGTWSIVREGALSKSTVERLLDSLR